MAGILNRFPEKAIPGFTSACQKESKTGIYFRENPADKPFW
jgi:hypothetical protein